MKYFFDTEFIEGFKEPLFGKKRHFIDLISIGIVCEDGREYYAISNEFNEEDASPWVRKNVISKLEYATDSRVYFGEKASKEAGKSNKQIAAEVYKFITDPLSDIQNIQRREYSLKLKYNPSDLPLFEFYGYYADYDWVLFCSLYGSMINLPFGYPMYCRDLKQMIDEKAEQFLKSRGVKNESTKIILNQIKARTDYPGETNAHNALDDARWNKKLYDFIKQL